jgi:hypothetical protein
MGANSDRGICWGIAGYADFGKVTQTCVLTLRRQRSHVRIVSGPPIFQVLERYRGKADFGCPQSPHCQPEKAPRRLIAKPAPRFFLAAHALSVSRRQDPVDIGYPDKLLLFEVLQHTAQCRRTGGSSDYKRVNSDGDHGCPTSRVGFGLARQFGDNQSTAVPGRPASSNATSSTPISTLTTG